MGLFRRRKRKDGERVLLRYPAERQEWGALCIMVAIPPPVMLLALGMSLFGHQLRVWQVALWAGGFLALGALLIWRSRWRVIVTTRRLLMRPGPLRREIVEIPLPTIADARYDPAGGRVVVTADDADYGVFCGASQAAAILDALRKARATS